MEGATPSLTLIVGEASPLENRLDFAGWMRNGDRDRLESISQGDGYANEQPTDWIGPLLGIRFRLDAGELEISRPDGQPFLSFVDLDLRRQAAEQRAETAEQRAETAEQRADDTQQQAARLAAKLRELGIDPANI